MKFRHLDDVGRGAALLLLLGCLGFAPQRASAQQDSFPFFITNSGVERVFACDGPWFRNSGGTRIAPNTQRHHFYTANETIFSALGEWFCRTTDDKAPALGVSFCLDVPACIGCGQPPRVEVDLKLGPNSFASNLKAPPCFRSMAAGFLGYPTANGQHDHDTFRFAGRAGESVTVNLERDGVKGSSGNTAQVILRNEQGDILEQDEGKLPVELQVLLPASGNYEVEAIQSTGTEAEPGTPFRGYYHLFVTDESGQNLALQPLPSTKP